MERSLNPTAHNLPATFTPLIGRDDVVLEIKALLERSRLVTLTGTGGIGKTRTSLQVAADVMAGGLHDVWFVDLALLKDSALVPSAIAEVFNISDEGGSRSLIDRVAAAIRPKQLLIVLDNCEHVIAAAAEAADRLVQLCPGLRILATSREPLSVPSEEPFRMPALSIPPVGERMTAERVMEFGAAALFVARAQTAQRDFTITDENAPVVANIVRRLDGIALAIELAAPRIRMLSLRDLDQHLDERFKLLSGGSRTAHPRQQTLRALIAWSYDLLSDAERSLLRQSAVFLGSWSLEAAEDICVDARFADWDVLNLLSSLIDKSLVVAEGEGGEKRYRLLESTRQFAAEELDEAGDRKAVAARHCSYFANVARRASDEFWQTDSDRWIAQTRRDLENHRAAIGWGLADDGDAVEAATIVAALRALWLAMARQEGRVLLERAKTKLPIHAPASIRGLLALALARLGYSSAQADEESTQALDVLAGGTDAIVRAEALTFAGYALGRAGQVDAALPQFDAALASARAARSPRLIAWILSIAAYWIGVSGDNARARSFFDEAATILRACNDRRALARLQSHRAEFLASEEDFAAALVCAREAESIYRASGDEANAAGALLNAAAYLLAMARFGEAFAAAGEGLELVVRAFDDDYWVAIAIGHLAHLAAEGGDLARAARLLGYVDAVYQAVGNARERTEQRGYDRTVELIRAGLSEDQFSAIAAYGALMGREGAVTEASAIPSPASTSDDAAKVPTVQALAEPGSARLTIDVATGEIFRGTSSVKVSEGTAQLTMLLAVNGSTGRDAIVDRMWPELDGDAAANALKMCIHRARTQLGDPSAIVAGRAMYSLGSGLDSNYRYILDCAARAVRPFSEGQRSEFEALFDRLTRGIASGRAPWPWFQPFANSLLDVMRALGEQLAEDELERGDAQTALQFARRMASVDPFHESARAILIRAYGKMGNWTAAIAEFREYSETLKREMDAEPSEQLRRLAGIS